MSPTLRFALVCGVLVVVAGASVLVLRRITRPLEEETPTVISTRNLESLPDVVGLRKLCRSIAVLDAILSPEWEGRFYSFNGKWAEGEQMASMRTGSGDQWFALFTKDGAVLHGLAHEAPMYRKDDPWDGIWNTLPGAFADFRTEPAFDTKNSTFLIWRLNTDRAWSRGEIEFPEAQADPDGSTALLSIFDGKPETYVAHAYERYEVELPLEVVKAIYDHAPLTLELVQTIDAEMTLEDVEEDMAEIGYPEQDQE